jgi:ubiquinone/menaquinone biosynthesis C-methylase UbiE
MALYEKVVVPWLIELAMRNQQLMGYRRQTIKAAHGLVLEIGVGSAMNLPLYSSDVDRVCGIDPSPALLDRASKRIADAHVSVSLVRASAEQLPFADASCDAALTTWTLCSIPNPSTALAEMHRVLKPGGRLLFVEHGLSPETG